jgi:cyanophycin synthetase
VHGQYNLVYEYRQRDVGLEAGRLAVQLLMHLLPDHVKAVDYEFDPEFDFPAELKSFVLMAQRKEFGPSTGSLVKAAEERDIPWIRLNNNSLVQFGHGKYQQRIQATITSQTKHIAVEISCDKEDTHNMLERPGPAGAAAAPGLFARRGGPGAKRIGYPVVVKPLDGNHGRGVSINLTEDAQVEVAFQRPRLSRKAGASCRAVRHRDGSPDAGGERRTGCCGQASARACRRRRQAYHRRTGRHREPGSAPRHRP